MVPRLATSLFLVAGALALGGCEVTIEDLREWRSVKDGERRIAAVIVDGERPTELRVRAALYLAEINAIYPLADALKQTAPGDRHAIVKQLVPLLVKMLRSEPTSQQPRAKDALYHVAGYLEGEQRDKAGRAIIDWATSDFSGRFALGRATLAQVLPDMGTAAVPGLIKLLRSGEAIPEVTDILSRFDTPQVHKESAEALIALIETLSPKAPEEAWTHLGRFKTPALVPFLLDKLTDSAVPAELKDEWFPLIVKCGGPEAGPGLARLLADHELRWIAAQNLVALEDVVGLKRLLEALPATDTYDEEELYDEVQFFCSKRIPELKATPAKIEEALITGLAPARVLATALAIHCLSLHGGPDTAELLKKLARDSHTVPGWRPDGERVGNLAKTAVEAIKQRGK